ncbi:MAG: Ig-like domain-containing protein [Flavobacteriales bacterium]|nr:Ig-like domain-containing protein [Flavobacteriales bacterium]
MKAIKFILGMGLMLAASSAFSQGLQGIVVEKYYQANAADVADATAAGAVTPLTTSSVTYRVYVDMAAGYKFNSLFGNAAHNLTVNTTTGFYNDPSWGVSINPGTVSTTNIRKNTGMIDSWFTTGGVAAGKAGVLKSEDTDGTIGNAQSILANNPGGCFGLPINGASGQDGFLPSSGTTYIVPNGLGLGSALDVLDQTNGGAIVLTNGSIAALGGVQGPTSSNMVLIGQFTTNGEFSFALNLQIQNIATGVAENYVSSNPTGSELTDPTLTLVPNVAPTITLAASPSSSAIINGTAMTFTATAADANGTITEVSFYLDGTLLSTDNTSPYTASYTAVAGAHTVYAIVTDNDCVSTQSSTLSFTSAANQAPTVTVTAPTTTVAGTVLTFTASASDVDGTVAGVEFFVNNVSIGTDNTAPYEMNHTAVLGSGQTVKAVATDDLGLTGTSNIVTMNVLANVPPTVSLTSPTSSDVISSYESAAAAAGAGASLTPVTFTASATDSDGTVTQVEFFVNGVSVGVDTTSPYSATWNSTSGTKSVTVTATDSNGATTTSSALTLVINDLLALPYEVQAVSQTCDIATYCVPVAAASTYTIDNVKGYDVVMNYDATKVVPTGNITVFNNTVNPALVDADGAISSPGVFNLSLSFNGTAPSSAEFAGTGNIFCVEFTRLAGFLPVDSSTVSISFLQESYITGVLSKPVTARKMYSTTQQNYLASLEFWSDDSDISYDVTSPNSYLITNINGVTGSTVSSTAVQPNVLGQFTHNLTNGTSIQISRDINNLNSIQLIVNAADAVIGKTLLLNQLSAPSIYQMISLDVNLDGVVSAGDLSQLKQRTTLAIPEFMQAWNYDNNGVSNGQASKDWIFVDVARLSNPAYQISATFPANDGVGYSKANVPVVPFILGTNVTGYNTDNSTCPTVGTETYKGIMLGDVDGSYAAYAADGILKTNQTDYILVDLNNVIVEGTKVSVPVSFISEEPVNAFDIALQVNENKLTYVSNEDTQLGSESESFYNGDDKTYRYTALNMNEFTSNARVSYITFETVDGKISEKDLTAELGLLNGKLTEVRFSKSAELGDNTIDIYPNPSNGMFTVMSNLDGRVDIIDITGKLVHPGALVKANQVMEVNMPELSAGVYFVRFYSNDALTSKRIVISE